MMRLLTAADIRRAISMRDAIAAVKRAFAELSSGQAAVPVRTAIATVAPAGTALYMPAYLAASQNLGMKAVTVYPGNSERGLPTIFAAVLLQDAATGRPTALLEGSYLTALRTGAATAAATDLLARPEASRLCLFGTGGQAPCQLEGVCAVRHIDEVWVWSRNPNNARTFIERMRQQHFAQQLTLHPVAEPQAVVPLADVIVTATPARSPLFAAADVRDGTHVNAIGAFTPAMIEVPQELVARAKVVVDSREACMAEAGDILIPIREGLIAATHIYAELGELVSGHRPGRTSSTEITLFKSVGNAVQDLAVGRLAMERAEREGLGQVIELS
jgi:alanine dehydrogenase